MELSSIIGALLSGFAVKIYAIGMAFYVASEAAGVLAPLAKVGAALS